MQIYRIKNFLLNLCCSIVNCWCPIRLVNPSDLKDRTLYALTKRVELDQTFVGIVEELQLSQKHNLSIDD
jgi:hypothetical protein